VTILKDIIVMESKEEAMSMAKILEMSLSSSLTPVCFSVRVHVKCSMIIV